MNAVVRGLSWDHPRGHAPLVAASDAWAHARGDVQVLWTPRSLADFAAGTLESYLGHFDLVACDHPLIGRAADAGWLTPLDGFTDTSIGASHASYQHDGHLWAAPVDAAALTLAYRPDLLTSPPQAFTDLITLARDTGRVAVPLSPFSAVAIYATFCAETNIDPFGRDPDRRHALERLAELAPYTSDHGSVQLLRTMAVTDELLVVAWPYGYNIYSRAGAIGAEIAFTAPPTSVPGIPARPTLGGVGLGLLTGAPAAEVAIELLRHLTNSDTQRGLYATTGGQPAHADAWNDTMLDHLTLGFFSNTKACLENAYIRPTAAWFEQAQPQIGAAIHAYVGDKSDAASTLEAIDQSIKAAS